MSEHPELPDAQDVLLSAAASLVNLAGIRLTEKEQRNPAKAKEAIDAARELLPLCPEEQIGPIREALSQLQMLYVKEAQQGPAAPQEQGAQPGEESPEADERAKARAKIWTPPGS